MLTPAIRKTKDVPRIHRIPMFHIIANQKTDRCHQRISCEKAKDKWPLLCVGFRSQYDGHSWKEDMKRDPTMCALVRNNQIEGVIVAKLNTQNRTHLIVAIQDAKPLFPISYLIRNDKYRAIWGVVREKDCFNMKDGYGNSVNGVENEDLLCLSKSTFWKVEHDLCYFGIQTNGMSWKEIWISLTREEVPTHGINSIHEIGRSIDFVELFNPRIFSNHKTELVSGTVLDMKPSGFGFQYWWPIRTTQTRFGWNESLDFFGGTVLYGIFFMQHINAKHNVGEVWEENKTQGFSFLDFAMSMCWDQIERGRFFLHEHPLAIIFWNFSMITRIGKASKNARRDWKHVSLGCDNHLKIW